MFTKEYYPTQDSFLYQRNLYILRFHFSLISSSPLLSSISTGLSGNVEMVLPNICITHCESGEGIWLQGEIASEEHSFRDAEPHPVIPENAKNNYEIFPKKLRPCNNTNLSTTDFCLPSTAWQWSVVCYYRICLVGPKNGTEYSLLSICLSLAVWLCLKMGYENRVLMRLMKIRGTDFTVNWQAGRGELCDDLPKCMFTFN